MSDDDQTLDPELQRRLSAAAREPGSALDAQAQQRVLAAVVAEGARLARERRRARIATGVGAIALAAAALIGWFSRAERAPLPQSAPAIAACGLPSGAGAPSFVRGDDGKQRLALHGYGLLVAEPSAELGVERAEACELTIDLSHGAVAGDLHSLRPARLRIRNALGEVVITGTRFSVRADGAFEVVLLSGVVDVLDAKQPPLQLTPGHVLRRSAAGQRGSIAAASDDDGRALAELLAVGAPAATREPNRAQAVDAGSPAQARATHKTPADSAALLAAAEAERRRGHLVQARALYAEAGSRADGNAEVALLRWTRLELEAGDAAAAERVLARYRQRFAQARLDAEASWLEVRVLLQLGRSEEARGAARTLAQRFPATPQAAAARKLLSQ
ncbi:MAG: hypothetical protein ACHQ53_12975 [Polyangiales bacterium]